jgi:hypothetical protein
MQPPETVEMQGKPSQLIRVFPGIYMNPEEFETEKRPRNASTKSGLAETARIGISQTRVHSHFP